MSESDNERAVRQMFEAFNRRDLDAWLDHFADEFYLSWINYGGGILTKERYREERALGASHRAFFSFREDTPFPDLRVRVERMVSQGDTVVVEWTATGTHTGGELLPYDRYGGIPATNEEVEMPGVCIFDFDEAGKVKQWKNYWNLLRLQRYLRDEWHMKGPP